MAAPWPPENMDPMETNEYISGSEGIRDKRWAGSHGSLQGQPCCSCSSPQKHFRTFAPPDQLLSGTFVPSSEVPTQGVVCRVTPQRKVVEKLLPGQSWQWNLCLVLGSHPAGQTGPPPSPHTINLSAPKQKVIKNNQSSLHPLMRHLQGNDLEAMMGRESRGKGEEPQSPSPKPSKIFYCHSRDLAARTADSQRGGASAINGSGSPHVPRTDPESPTGSAL